MNYTLHVPAEPPARLFWSVTAYDVETRCLMDTEWERGDRGSRDDLVREPDGSVVVHFGPRPPAGRDANWIPTLPGRHWFAYFRLYGPEQAYFDRDWQLGDVTPAV